MASKVSSARPSSDAASSPALTCARASRVRAVSKSHLRDGASAFGFSPIPQNHRPNEWTAPNGEAQNVFLLFVDGQMLRQKRQNLVPPPQVMQREHLRVRPMHQLVRGMRPGDLV